MQSLVVVLVVSAAVAYLCARGLRRAGGWKRSTSCAGCAVAESESTRSPLPSTSTSRGEGAPRTNVRRHSRSERE
jgi:hypothetical protein